MPPQPDPPTTALPGPTTSAPLNVGIGGVATGALNAGSLALTQDPQINLMAALLNFLAEHGKGPPWFAQHRWLKPLLLMGGIGLGLVVYHGDYINAILRGGMAAVLAHAQYHTIKASGLGIVEPSTEYPDSKEASQ